jgi:hypothetical protein
MPAVQVTTSGDTEIPERRRLAVALPDAILDEKEHGSVIAASWLAPWPYPHFA